MIQFNIEVKVDDSVEINISIVVMCQIDEVPGKRRKRQVQEKELTEKERMLRSYGTKLGYSCGLARMFQNDEGDLYDEMWLTCNWNKTWTKYDTLDDCVWVQCINPPLVDKLFVESDDMRKSFFLGSCQYVYGFTCAMCGQLKQNFDATLKSIVLSLLENPILGQ